MQKKMESICTRTAMAIITLINQYTIERNYDKKIAQNKIFIKSII